MLIIIAVLFSFLIIVFVASIIDNRSTRKFLQGVKVIDRQRGMTVLTYEKGKKPTWGG